LNWMEICLPVSHSTMDVAASILCDLGAGGVVMEDPRLLNEYLSAGIWDYTDIKHVEKDETVIVKAYLPQDDELNGRLSELRFRLRELAQLSGLEEGIKISCREVKDEDWANNWKEYWHTQKIGRRLVIKPTWEDYAPVAGEAVIELDPGSAFGTGSHPTTMLCLGLLEEFIAPQLRVIDIGTGSGVLAIAAAKLGAGEVTAVDADSAALEAARSNVKQNCVGQTVRIEKSDLWQNVSGRGDIVVANIIADVILRLLPELKEHLTAKGIFIAGGIIEDRIADVKTAAKAAGFTVDRTEESRGWAAMVIRGDKGQ